jgi:transposase
MEKPLPELLATISPQEWSQVPEKVVTLIEELVRRIEVLEQGMTELRHENAMLRHENAMLRQENAMLKEQLKRNSGNSSQPPSQDPPGYKPNRQASSGKKRGGQAGHKGYERQLYPLEKCQSVIEHYPIECNGCGTAIRSDSLGRVYRHQVIELPPVTPIITEHQFYGILCPCCGKENQAPEMLEMLRQGNYGPRTAAYVGLLSSEYRQSYRQIQKVLAAVFGITMSLGTINRLRTEVSEAVRESVKEAIECVQHQPIVGVDETGFNQGNGDGQNASQTSGWLWVAVTPWLTCFQVILSRATTAAQSVLGKTFAGWITSDRCPAYNWVDIECRQLCWAHLKRDFIQMAERTGVSAEIGQSLLEQEKELFNLWHQFKNDQLNRLQLQQSVVPIQAHVLSILQETAQIPIAAQEKTPLAKTVRSCRNLLKFEVALWLFIREEGVEPTNNAAERAIRPAVIWRKTSFGSDSAAGSLFVSRLLTVIASLHLQKRCVLDFLVESVCAAREGFSPPSLVPLPSP